MKAEEVALQQLLNGKIQYRVPLFQRTYSWGEKDWERLWTDVLEIHAMHDPRNHFIGAVVTQPIADAPERAAKYLLIDGQQRLTTLFIMLACIRRQASQNPDLWIGLPDEIWETCLANKFADHSQELLKLQPTQRDRESFSAAMTLTTTTSKNGKIFEALDYFSKKMCEGDLEGHPIDLRKLKSCITNRLALVSITLGEEDSPHRIFESLNNTGMRLGPSDLIRNLLFMTISTEEEAQNAYSEHWFPMQEATGSRLDDFFWRYLMMDGSLPRWDETYEEIKRRFGSGTSDDAVEALIRFSKYAGYYRWLCNIGDDNDKPSDQVSEAIKRLKAWDVDVAYPFLMQSLNWMSEQTVDPKEVAKVMAMVESFVIRRVVCNVPTNRLRSIFARMSDAVDSSGLVQSAHRYLLDNHWPSDEDFKSKFVEFRLYSTYRLARSRLILESLEQSFGHKESPEITEDITIEHIMPQTLTGEWECMLGSQHDEIHSRWLHAPGNLTLTGYNPELSNASFHEKKTMLECAKFSLTDSVLTYDKWGDCEIRERGEALAEKAIAIWRR